MDTILEQLLQYGIASVAMVILSYVALQQMKLLSMMAQKLSDASDRITRIEMKQDQLISMNEDSLEAVRDCRVRNNLKN